MNRKLAFVCIVSVPMLIGCYEKRESVPRGTPAPTVTISDVKSDATKAINSASEYSLEQKQQMVQQWRDQLAAMDSQIEGLRKGGEQLSVDAKDKWEKKMTELESKRQASKDKFRELENSTAEAWHDIEKGAAAAWDDVKKTFEEVSKEFERKN